MLRSFDGGYLEPILLLALDFLDLAPASFARLLAEKTVSFVSEPSPL